MSTSEFYELDTSKYGPLKRAFGCYKGICEDNQDPKGLGRIKVRVPSIHGIAVGGADFMDSGVDTDEEKSGNGITTEALPWAWPCFRTGGVYDSGEFDIPLIGSGIWIVFEQGDTDFPIWIGTWPAMPEREIEANTIKSWNLPENKDSISMGTWMQKTGLSVPREAHDSKDDPQVRVIAKSPKGATIVAIDTDASETLMIIDRSGQMIEMYSPVIVNKNQNNNSQRGLKTARNNNSLDPSIYNKNNKAYIRIIDTSYQTNQSGERVWSGQFIKLSAEKDKENVRIHGASGHDIYLDSTKNNQKIIVKSNNGDFICFDSSGIRIRSSVNKNVTIEGNANVSIKGNYTIKIGGTFEIDCNNLIIKSNNVTLNSNSFTNKSNSCTINGASELELVGSSLKIGSTGSIEINAGGSIIEAGSTHTTKAGSIAHTSGSGTSPTIDNPETPSNPNDPAGNVNIPDENFPIG